MEPFGEWVRRRQKKPRFSLHKDDDRKAVTPDGARLDLFLKSVDALEGDWEQLILLLGKKAAEEKAKRAAEKAKPKKPDSTSSKPELPKPEKSEEPGEEDEEDEE